jgi:hypothetical protein
MYSIIRIVKVNYVMSIVVTTPKITYLNIRVTNTLMRIITINRE